MSTVVRRGQTVHRGAGPWTPTIHRLLEHLHSHGITWLPRPRGLDEQGREVLTYLPEPCQATRCLRGCGRSTCWSAGLRLLHSCRHHAAA
jgi:hypothetical protein